MEKPTCKLCLRRFANGRALGGHMRSHVVGAAKPLQVSSASSASGSSSPEEEGEEDEDEEGGAGAYVLRENPRKSCRLVDPEFAADAPALSSSGDVLDRASDTESPRAPLLAQRPLKRRRAPQPPRRAPFPDPDAGSSSISNAASAADERVALSLMMLSRDSWPAAPVPSPQTLTDGSDAEALAPPPPPSPPRRRRRFQCGTCKKVFRSYQALGGHRASHKKSHGWCFPPPPPTPTPTPTPTPPPPPPPPPPEIRDAGKLPSKLHRCPFCSRVFGSGQALGGHKRSHFSSSSSYAASVAVAPPPTANYAAFFDLNLPAPFDDEFELSAISDAEFVANHHHHRYPPT